jgi:hypothetical protein
METTFFPEKVYWRGLSRNEERKKMAIKKRV